MNISKNSQLGLRGLDSGHLKVMLDSLHRVINEEKEYAKSYNGNDIGMMETDGDILLKKINKRLGYMPENKGSEFYTTKHPGTRYYLIMSTVEFCAYKINIKEGFTCSIFRKIKDGDYMYLMGKSEMLHLTKFNDVIRGMFWNSDKQIAFEFGFDLDEDSRFYPFTQQAEFFRLLKIMIFVELGDVEIEILEKNRNNGKTKANGKITNNSENTVYIVDSSWNKLIIRTEGFAVMGHFRLQACGEGFKDRKLKWIGAFEKHGYKRSPKAKIIHD